MADTLLLHSGERTRLPPMSPGFDSPGRGVICGLSLLLVLVLARRRFSSGTLVFPSPQKPTFLASNSILNLRATGLSVIPDPLERALDGKQEDLIGWYMISRDSLWEVHVS